MAVDSETSGMREPVAALSRARSPSRAMTRRMSARTAGLNRSGSAAARLPATVPLPALARGRRLGADPCDAVERELGEERVEAGEVPVQHSLGHARFRGDRAAGQAAGAVPEEDALGGIAGAAKAAAVLRPRGRLVVFWNAFDPPEDLREAFSGVFRRVLPDSPSGGF
jgi:hypothetical protein